MLLVDGMSEINYVTKEKTYIFLEASFIMVSRCKVPTVRCNFKPIKGGIHIDAWRYAIPQRVGALVLVMAVETLYII